VSPGTIALILVAAGIVVWALFMANVTIRRSRKAATAGAPPIEDTSRTDDAKSAQPMKADAASEGAANTPRDEVTVDKVPDKKRKPLTPDQLAVSRRQFLNRAWTASFMTFLGLFGMSSLSFLWPKLTGGFGTKITAGNYDELLKEIGPENNFKPKFIAEGRFWLTYYEGTGDSPVYTAIGAVDAKMQALYRKCVHLGCSVPHCDTSMLFECPCHGSKYRLHGEYFAGPAPRGLDRFPITIEGDKVVVDTGDLQTGPPRGTDTWDKFAQQQGGFCVPV
jgi:cytochrome b6-f complex iron-sulfur subunit